MEKTYQIDISKFKPNENAINIKIKKPNQPFESKITKFEFKNVVKKLKTKSAPGSDQITYQHLKNLPDNIINYLIELFNEAIETGTVPKEWKVAKIRMLLKPGKNELDINSYRPISLTSCLAKCLEKFILNRLNQHLRRHNIIVKNQSGFRAGHSTKDHIFRLSNNIINGFNEYKYSGAIMIDVEKAFDNVWLAGLLYKLQQIRTPAHILFWIQSFIVNRKFFITYNEQVSTIRNIEAGVPQGCILSPTLFSIYLNDLSKQLNDTHGTYADDITAWTSSESLKQIEHELNKETTVIYDYCQEWCLKLSETKTTYTIFTNAGKRKSYDKIYSINIQINNKQIQLEPYPKFLGITFDPKLSFQKHFEQIEQSIYKRINILRVLKGKYWASSNNFLINFYKSYIRPLLEYSNIPFLISSNSIQDKLQILQNKILRICLNADMYDTTTEIHQTANIPMLKDRIIQLSNEYYSKHDIQGTNQLVREEIRSQNKKNEDYSKISEHTRKRRATPLDHYKTNTYDN